MPGIGIDLAGPMAAQTKLGAGTECPAGPCRMAGELGADGVDAGGDKGDVDGGIDGGVDRDWGRVIVAPIADHALGDVMLDARHNAVRDTLSDSEARTANGTGSVDSGGG